MKGSKWDLCDGFEGKLVVILPSWGKRIRQCFVEHVTDFIIWCRFSFFPLVLAGFGIPGFGDLIEGKRKMFYIPWPG